MVVIIFFGGVFLIYAIDNNLFTENETINKILIPLGNMLIGVSAFLIILKSLQYLGIFKQSLLRQIYDTNFQNIIKDVRKVWYKYEYEDNDSLIRQLWKNASRIIYNRKFPEISDEIEDIICDYYLPANINYYHKDVKVDVKIEWHDASHKHIIVTESIDYTIVANIKSDIIPYTSTSTIHKKANDRVPNYELNTFQINNVEFKNKCDYNCDLNSKKGKEIKATIHVNLEGSKTYKILKKVTKIYSPEDDPDKSMTYKNFVKNLEISLKHPKDLIVRFYPLGTIEKFCDHSKVSDNVKRKLYYRGLIFPSQGFRFVYVRLINWRDFSNG